MYWHAYHNSVWPKCQLLCFTIGRQNYGNDRRLIIHRIVLHLGNGARIFSVKICPFLNMHKYSGNKRSMTLLLFIDTLIGMHQWAYSSLGLLVCLIVGMNWINVLKRNVLSWTFCLTTAAVCPIFILSLLHLPPFTVWWHRVMKTT